MLQGTIANTLGAGFLGLVAACILFGVTVVQNWIYYGNFPNDWAFQKISVGILLVLDALHLSLTIHAMYHYMIIRFGDVTGLQSVVWSFKLQTTLNVVIVFLVQRYFYIILVVDLYLGFPHAHKLVYIEGVETGKTQIARTPNEDGTPYNRTTCVVLAGGIIGAILCVKTYQLPQFENIREASTKWVVSASFAMSTVIDVVLACAICYYLYENRSAFTSTNNRIVVIMHYVLISGAFTAACSLSALITFVIMPNNMIFLGISFLLTKLYINSYVAMLNARSSGKDHESSSINVAKLMNLKRRQKAATIDNPDGETPADRDSLALSSIGYRSKSDGNDIDTKHGKADLSTTFGGVTIHRIEERKYDDELKDWNRV